MTRIGCLLTSLLLSFGASPALADPLEEPAQRFLARAVRSESRGRLTEARAWFRAASACYRYVVLPVRLAQLDHFHESGRLLPDDLPGAPELGNMVLERGYLEARHRLAEHYRERATATLRRAQALGTILEVRPPGVVPLEPPAPRAEFERVLEEIVTKGAWTHVLAPVESDTTAPGDSTPPGPFPEWASEWQREGRHADFAAAAEYTARLARECAVRYHDAMLKSLRRSTDADAVDGYRARLEASRERVANAESAASRAYAAAATTAQELGDITRAIAYTGRALRLQPPEQDPNTVASPRP